MKRKRTASRTESNDSNNERVIFVANMDSGILCATNIDGVFGQGVEVRDALAAKCQSVADRGVWYGKEGDAILLYRRPDQGFVDYASMLYNHEMHILAPAHVTDAPLDMFRDVRRDPKLLSELRRGVTKHGWGIAPFIQSPGAAHLADEVGARLHAGMCHHAVKRGLALDLNDKETFTKVCQELGIKVPDTTYAKGWDNLVETVKEYRQRWGSLMLRIARAAGGLGNLVLHKDDDLEAKLRTVMNAPGWQTETVVIGRLLELDDSPSTLAFINAHGNVEVLADSIQILEGGSAYVGSRFPSGLDDATVRLMHDWTMQYARHASALGGRGYLNIDWIRSDGELLAIESNFRHTAAVHPLAIRKHLCNGDERVARSHDALHVEHGLTFANVREHLDAEGLLFNSQTRTGAVITIPPARGSMGYVVMATNATEANEMAAAIHRLLEHEPH